MFPSQDGDAYWIHICAVVDAYWIHICGLVSVCVCVCVVRFHKNIFIYFQKCTVGTAGAGTAPTNSICKSDSTSSRPYKCPICKSGWVRAAPPAALRVAG